MLHHGKIITLDITQLPDSTPLDTISFLLALRIKKLQKKVAVDKRVFVVTARHITSTWPVYGFSVNVIPDSMHCHRIDTSCELM